MTGHDEPTVAGELVVRNGKHAGTRVRLGATATLIGAGEGCDVRIAGPSMADVHCLITASPAGPALRSWRPDQTLVNGQPTAAGLLRDGDEVRVGPCVFTLEWHVEDLIPLLLAPPDEVAVEPVPEWVRDEVAVETAVPGPEPVAEPPPVQLFPALPDEAWDLFEQKRQLFAQEAAVAAELDRRREQLTGWLDELAATREEVRQLRTKEKSATAADRAKARELRAEGERLQAAAHKDRARAKALGARYLKRMRAKCANERQAVAAERAELEAARGPFAETVARFRAEAAATQRRQADGWALLTAGQRRLLSDRQRAEQTAARREAVADQRVDELNRLEHAHRADESAAVRRVAELKAEVARLEHRGATARAVVQRLEDQRSTLEVAPAAATVDRVALAVNPAKSAEELLAELAIQHRDLERERAELVAARQELMRRAGDLVDQRAVVAEQVATVAVARHLWQSTECRTLADLEDVARELVAREQQVVAREIELTEADRVRRQREREFWDVRAKLDAWQASLATHEATAAAARDRAEAELAGKRAHLEKWEAALGTLCRKWSTARHRDVRRLRDELAYWSEARTRYRLALAEADEARERMLGEVAVTAGESLATAQLGAGQPATAGPLADRRVRVLRRRWERHFDRFRREIDARKRTLAADTAVADERFYALTRLSAVATERYSAAAAAEQEAELRRAVRERDLDERAVVLSIAQAQADRTARELAAARTHADEIAAALIGADAPRPPALEANPLVLAIAPRAA